MFHIFLLLVGQLFVSSHHLRFKKGNLGCLKSCIYINVIFGKEGLIVVCLVSGEYCKVTCGHICGSGGLSLHWWQSFVHLSDLQPKIQNQRVWGSTQNRPWFKRWVDIVVWWFTVRKKGIFILDHCTWKCWWLKYPPINYPTGRLVAQHVWNQ